MPMPEMIPVESSNIFEYGYDSDARELYVTFHKGNIPTSTYVYIDFPVEEWEVFRDSPADGSWGKHFSAYIRNNYRYVKL